jgi:hypothetical protein
MKKLSLSLVMALLTLPMAANAALIQGTPTPFGQPANPIPLFGTLIDFDDQPTGTCLAANQYVADGVTSITNSLAGALCYFPTSQSAPNYIGTGFANSWDADITVQFATAQAAVGIGIAGPTTLLFELLDASHNVLETYNLTTTPVNTYYYINRASNDAVFLHIRGDFVAIDDLQFDVSPVNGTPEPATLALLGIALAGLGFSRRRNPD